MAHRTRCVVFRFPRKKGGATRRSLSSSSLVMTTLGIECTFRAQYCRRAGEVNT